MWLTLRHFHFTEENKQALQSVNGMFYNVCPQVCASKGRLCLNVPCSEVTLLFSLTCDCQQYILPLRAAIALVLRPVGVRSPVMSPQEQPLSFRIEPRLILLSALSLCPQTTPATAQELLLPRPLSTQTPAASRQQLLPVPSTSSNRSTLKGECPQPAQAIGDIPRFRQEQL